MRFSGLRGRHFGASSILSLILSAGACVAAEPPAAPPEEAAGTVAAKSSASIPPGAASLVTTVDDLRAIPDDYWAAGGFGDTLLENDRASFVFGKLPVGEEARDAKRNGSLIDIFPGARASEFFSGTQPMFADSNAIYYQATSMESKSDDATGSASVIENGIVTNEPTIGVSTEYRLDRDHFGLVVTTTVTNKGTEPVTLPVLGDYVEWGMMSAFLPSVGVARGGSAEVDSEFVYGRYADVYVMFAPLEGLVTVKHNQEESRLIYRRDVTIAPGESTSYARAIGTCIKTPTPLLAEALAEKKGAAYGTIVGRVIERAQTAGGNMIDRDVARNADVAVSVAKRADVPQEYVGHFYISTQTNERGEFSLVLPVGEYAIDIVSPSRASSHGRLAVQVEAGKVHAVDYGVSPAATLVFEIVDAETKKSIPGKVSLVPMRGSRPPYLGDPGSLASGDSVSTMTGRGLVEVPAGNYRVIASHGIEYDTVEQKAAFTAGQTETLRFELPRAFTTEGWVAADVAVRTNNSPDVRVTPEDRVVTALVEGLTWIVTADTSGPTDLQPAIERLRAGDMLRASMGLRTGGEQLPLRGDFLLFPYDLASNAQRETLAALMKRRDIKAEELLGELKEACPDAVTVAMRAVFPEIGYLALEGGNDAQATVPPGKFNASFDGFEIWNGKKQNGYDRGYSAYQQLLSRGVRATPFGASDSGGTWNAEVGYPRVYIKASKTDARSLDPAELARNFRAGLVQTTNGPFIKLKVDGQEAGSIITAKDKKVSCDLEVYAANWVPLTRVSVFLNGRFTKTVLVGGLKPEKGGRIFPPADKPENGRFNVILSGDSVLEAIVQSEGSINQDPVNPYVVPTGDSKIRQGQRTIAWSPAFWVDANGEGKVDIPPFLPKTTSDINPEDQPPPF